MTSPTPAAARRSRTGSTHVGDSSGFVNVGADHDTAQFAAESVRRWWQAIGKARYPAARRLLVTCDAGGSNGSLARAWKSEMARLAAESGLEITICHFPPGTSKWNKIEHRLFCHITRTWRGLPLTSYQVVVNTIAATATRAGLTVTAVLVPRPLPGRGRGDRRADEGPAGTGFLARHGFHGDWNYTILPVLFIVPYHGLEPAPRRTAPDLAALDQPALTGLPPGGAAALAAALAIPHATRPHRAARLHARLQGRPRQRADTPPNHPPTR